jgi:hypothetical protein
VKNVKRVEMSIWQGVEGFRGREGGRQERCPGYLAAGQSADQIVAEFPDLTRDQIAACLDYARASIRN